MWYFWSMLGVACVYTFVVAILGSAEKMDIDDMFGLIVFVGLMVAVFWIALVPVLLMGIAGYFIGKKFRKREKKSDDR